MVSQLKLVGGWPHWKAKERSGENERKREKGGYPGYLADGRFRVVRLTCVAVPCPPIFVFGLRLARAVVSSLLFFAFGVRFARAAVSF